KDLPPEAWCYGAMFGDVALTDGGAALWLLVEATAEHRRFPSKRSKHQVEHCKEGVLECVLNLDAKELREMAAMAEALVAFRRSKTRLPFKDLRYLFAGWFVAFCQSSDKRLWMSQNPLWNDPPKFFRQFEDLPAFTPTPEILERMFRSIFRDRTLCEPPSRKTCERM